MTMRPSSKRPGRRWCPSTRSRQARTRRTSRPTTISTADDVADDDTFLEDEEEGDDDVSDLIDSDLEDDEEA